MNIFKSAVFIVIAFSIASSGIALLTQEESGSGFAIKDIIIVNLTLDHRTGLKRLQMQSGCVPWAYWGASLLVDGGLFLVTLAVCALPIALADLGLSHNLDLVRAWF